MPRVTRKKAARLAWSTVFLVGLQTTVDTDLLRLAERHADFDEVSHLWGGQLAFNLMFGRGPGLESGSQLRPSNDGTSTSLRSSVLGRRSISCSQSQKANSEDPKLLRVEVSYAQTANKVDLPGGDAQVRAYMQRSLGQILDDIGKGRGDWQIREVDASAQHYVVNHPPGRWTAPGGLGGVNITGPQLEMKMQDVTDEPPKLFPAGKLPSWHEARGLIKAKLTNGRNLAQVELTVPLLPPIRFNASASADFLMEIGFAGGSEAGSSTAESGKILLGLDGVLGLSLPRIPGAATLMSLFCPSYIRKAMKEAAEGLARRYEDLGFGK